jgi:hypothetical protein
MNILFFSGREIVMDIAWSNYFVDKAEVYEMN